MFTHCITNKMNLICIKLHDNKFMFTENIIDCTQSLISILIKDDYYKYLSFMQDFFFHQELHFNLDLTNN